MAITLGSVPDNLRVVLTKGADFYTVLHNQTEDWPVGVQIELRIGGEVWEAAIAGPDATFSVDYLVVDALLATKHRRAALFYIDGDFETAWATGEVYVSG